MTRSWNIVMTRIMEHCDDTRSEEHTSELQSLTTISYAVFCLKKKNNPYRRSSDLMENCDDMVMEHCDDKGHGAL